MCVCAKVIWLRRNQHIFKANNVCVPFAGNFLNFLKWTQIPEMINRRQTIMMYSNVDPMFGGSVWQQKWLSDIQTGRRTRAKNKWWIVAGAEANKILHFCWLDTSSFDAFFNKLLQFLLKKAPASWLYGFLAAWITTIVSLRPLSLFIAMVTVSALPKQSCFNGTNEAESRH